ncbi:MAG: lysylphosphatidylglycerol synthase domain-containing protein, partial [Planctomycetota bacterium]
ALEANLGWSIALCSYPLAVLAGLLPLTVSGIGTRDSAMALLFGQHIPLEEAVLLGLGYTFFVYWMLSLICLPAVFWEVRAYLRRSQGDANTVIRGELETAR